MRLDWIEDILAVLETGSFTAAAERRYLTPSAFTRRIRTMEKALGCPLFDRERKPITLLPHVQGMEAELRDGARMLRELRLGLSDPEAQEGRRLSLGCQHALTAMVAPHLAGRLGRARDVALRIRSGTRADCHLMLLRHEVDIGLIYETPEDALQFEQGLFEKIPLGLDALVPVANLQVFPGLAGQLDAGQLPLIRYPADIYLGEVMRVQIMPGLPSGLSPFSVAETGLTPAVLQFIRQGLGIGWVPRSVAFEAIKAGELADLSDRLPVTQLTVQAVRARSGGHEVQRDAWRQLRDAAGALRVDGITPLT